MNETNLGKIDRTTIDSEVHAIDHGAILYSQAGAARVRINFDVWELRGHDVLIFFPGDVVKWEMMDDDFKADIIRYSSDILRAASLNIVLFHAGALPANRSYRNPAFTGLLLGLLRLSAGPSARG